MNYGYSIPLNRHTDTHISVYSYHYLYLLVPVSGYMFSMLRNYGYTIPLCLRGCPLTFVVLYKFNYLALYPLTFLIILFFALIHLMHLALKSM